MSRALATTTTGRPARRGGGVRRPAAAREEKAGSTYTLMAPSALPTRKCTSVMRAPVGTS